MTMGTMMAALGEGCALASAADLEQTQLLEVRKGVETDGVRTA
jgi:hypothetical protein